MQPHQERVVTEKKELDDKIQKLATFTTGNIFEALPVDEKERLNNQITHMCNYSNVLGDRIAAFTDN